MPVVGVVGFGVCWGVRGVGCSDFLRYLHPRLTRVDPDAAAAPEEANPDLATIHPNPDGLVLAGPVCRLGKPPYGSAAAAAENQAVA